MSFHEYMRWDGWLAVVVGAGLYVFGLANGHQGAIDAAFSGAITFAGTGVFMAVRHRAPFCRPGAWFTARPLAEATAHRAARPRRSLLAGLLGETAAFTALTLGLSYLSAFWLTYMDAGVWMVAIGVVKIGPAATLVARHEARAGATYRVARRPLRGLVKLTAG